MMSLIVPEQNKCSDCREHRKLFFTGRRWICARCWMDNFNEDPEEHEVISRLGDS